MLKQRYVLLLSGVLLWCAAGAGWLSAQVPGITKPAAQALEIRVFINPPKGEVAMPETIRVTLQEAGYEYDNTQVLRGDRTCTFQKVPQGIYYVTVEADGYQPVQVQLDCRERAFGTMAVTASIGSKLAPGQGLAIPAPGGQRPRLPKKALLEFREAREAANKNDYESALKHLDKATRAYPKFYQAYNEMAAIQMKMNRNTEAMQSLQNALEAEPLNSYALTNLGYLYLVSKKEKEALELLNKSLELNPGNSMIHNFLGEALFQAGQPEEAIGHLKKAAELDPGAYRAFYRLGFIYVSQKNYPEALASFQNFLKTNKGMDQSKVQQVEKIVGQLEQALKTQ